jgi:hypothetical protein
MFRLATLVFVVFASYAQAAETLSLAHHYKATGEGPDGSKYTGDVKIDITSDTTFSIQWDIGGTHFDGFGMRRNDVLSASFFSGKSAGLVIYEVQGDGLDGIWTFKGENGVGTERLTPAD